jgi:hypothetical protein
MVLGSTQPLTEISTRNLPGDKPRQVRKADNLTTICEDYPENVGSPTSDNLYGPPRPVTERERERGRETEREREGERER